MGVMHIRPMNYQISSRYVFREDAEHRLGLKATSVDELEARLGVLREEQDRERRNWSQKVPLFQIA